jgi:nudix-type nucleoside diphosphatase (YffH/AdpP family)
VEALSCDWYVLRKTTFDYRHSDGHWSREQRETYDRGDGATILLYDQERETVLLTRQFRLPAYVNGHPDGMPIETAAGLLEGQTPEEAIRREALEETGRAVGTAEYVFAVFMSPGSVTERLHFFAAPYEGAASGLTRQGVAEEGEDIIVLELPFAKALDMVYSGEIAAPRPFCCCNGPLCAARSHIRLSVGRSPSARTSQTDSPFPASSARSSGIGRSTMPAGTRSARPAQPGRFFRSTAQAGRRRPHVRCGQTGQRRSCRIERRGRRGMADGPITPVHDRQLAGTVGANVPRVEIAVGEDVGNAARLNAGEPLLPPVDEFPEPVHLTGAWPCDLGGVSPSPRHGPRADVLFARDG